MERMTPVAGEIYKHFKDKYYQIIGIAKHSETKEKMVVYQGLYDDFSLYVRPYEMFMSKVDNVKYPDVLQEYRFEKVGNIGNGFKIESKSASTINKENAEKSVDEKNCVEEDTVSEETPNPDLMAFLDARTYQEKRQLLISMRPRMTDRLINDIAMSLDVTVEDGDIERRFKSLLYCVSKLDEYEVDRFR